MILNEVRVGGRPPIKGTLLTLRTSRGGTVNKEHHIYYFKSMLCAGFDFVHLIIAKHPPTGAPCMHHRLSSKVDG